MYHARRQHPNFLVGSKANYAGACLWSLAFALGLLQLQALAMGLVEAWSYSTPPPQRNSMSQLSGFSVAKVLTQE